MPNYLLAYHGGSNPEGEEAQAEMMEAWNDWLDAVGENLLDAGNPGGQSKTLNADGSVVDTSSNPVSGYSILEANDIDDAVELARGCPVLANGGSVEVTELFDLMGYEDDEDEDDEEEDEDDKED